MDKDSPTIELIQLSKFFPKSQTPALSKLDAKIFKGQLTGVIGPDGAGKTTLLRILAGLLTISEGQIRVLQLDPMSQAKELHKNIGYMPQKFGLYEDLTVLQNLSLYADLQGLEKHKKLAVFEKLLSFTDLKNFTNRLAKNLSGGMKQKLGLACVLLRKPKIILLDEPSVGVDPISRRELWKMVSTLIQEEITVIWSTCYLDEAEKCDNVLLLNEGKLLYHGPPKDFTFRVNEQVFLCRPPKEKKRETLAYLCNHSSVVDCTVQGESLRIVLKKGVSISSLDLDTKIEPTQPRFEDAFIHTLSPSGIKFHPDISHFNEEEIIANHVIEANQLTKNFDHFTAVDKINFSVQKGEIFGLLGPNGAGKSTTFKMLCGLLKPSSGSSSIMGLSFQEAPSKARSKIGYMAQKFSLYGDLSCLENLQFFSGIYPVPASESKSVIQEMIQMFDLAAYADTTTKDLPLGFKQRLALACALMHKPKILFLDEPTSGVDPITRREFWSHINTLVKKGITVMITTHFMDEAEYCDRIGLINKGRLMMLGSPEELKKAASSQQNPYPTLEDAFITLSQETPS